ncbi:MAG: NAD(P)-binding domain-containing protein [Calditrichia bacterium]
MRIAIIGSGNVGGALARGWAKVDHDIILGVRNANSEKIKSLTEFSKKISVVSISEAIESAKIVVFSTPPDVAISIAEANPALLGKIVIDATNSVFKKPLPYTTAFEGIKDKSGCKSIVKCFNSTGYENINNPVYGQVGIDMFVAGDDSMAKSVAMQLAKELGFAECYDFGGDDKIELLEQFAFVWINMGILQKHGRDMAFKVLKRH